MERVSRAAYGQGDLAGMPVEWRTLSPHDFCAKADAAISTSGSKRQLVNEIGFYAAKLLLSDAAYKEASHIDQWHLYQLGRES